MHCGGGQYDLGECDPQNSRMNHIFDIVITRPLSALIREATGGGGRRRQKLQGRGAANLLVLTAAGEFSGNLKISEGFVS